MAKQEQVKVRPLGDRIVVRKEKAKEMTPGGLHLPDQAQEKPCKGVVLAVGPGKFVPELLSVESYDEDLAKANRTGRLPVAVKVGDVVLFAKWAGNDVTEMGDDVVMLREDDILGVVE